MDPHWSGHPDADPDPGLDDQKLKKVESCLYFLIEFGEFPYPYASIKSKDTPSYRKGHHPSKENIQHIKT